MKNEPTIERTTSPSRSTDSPAPHLADKLPDRFQNRDNESVDHELINKTKQQIRNLVNEIAELSRSETDTRKFFEGFLIRSTSALASVGGAVWLNELGSGPLKLIYQINFDSKTLGPDSSAQKRHSLLLEPVRQVGEPRLIPPNSGTAEDTDAGNPCEHLLIFAP